MTNKNFVISIIIVVILALIGFFLSRISAPRSSAPLQTERAVLSLSSEKDVYKTGDRVRIDVYLASGMSFDGVDILLKYDPVFLAPSKNLLDGRSSIFKDFFGPIVNKERGEIKISALLEKGTKFQGETKIASLIFFAKQKGKTKIEFVFKKKRTTDSNVSSFDRQEDILDKVENLFLRIN